MEIVMAAGPTAPIPCSISCKVAGSEGKPTTSFRSESPSPAYPGARHACRAEHTAYQGWCGSSSISIR